MDNGEQTGRLERLENDIAETKTRITNLENEMIAVKQGANTMQSQLAEQDAKLDKIVDWVEGVNKIAGIATRHWRTALKFGCGVVTAYGISNPHVQATVSFVGKFFGI